MKRSALGLALILALLSSILASQAAGAETDRSLQTWTCNGMTATVVGTPGSETVRGTNGPDVIVAREGNDTIYAMAGDDIVCAGKGNDRVYGGAGFDIIFGAQGNDLIYASGGAASTQRGDTRGARMFGGADDDIIHGSNKWDRMQGGLGNDELIGYEGRDWLRAGPGNDTVNGGLGIDDQHGGNGRDTIEMTNGDIIRGGAGLDQCNIASGEPSFFRSCGFNERETPPRGLVITQCNRQNEYVDILNDSPTARTLTNWILHDANVEHTYTFGGLTLQPGTTVRVLSGLNPVASPGRIIGWEGNVWNNTGDTAFLLDPNETEQSRLVCS